MIGRLSKGVAIGAVAAILGMSVAGAGDAPQAQRPLLSDLMLLSQLRQMKLWYAEKAENWRLAAYELEQLKGTFDRAVALYPTAGSVSQDTPVRDRIDPAAADLNQAIAAKNKSRFTDAYGRLTDACNACHAAADVGFISVRVPTMSPFGNQLFAPQP